ncbi:unnamed protein product [Triticum turgidum subsp. durum]|uniref:ABC transmembrane type-1 domain-containing protein n=1 Tax=Triticum turgidum subsp. durum TaxID=4567 RepID=A0A9R1R0I0_TRITD|nr:unnamed protein product [Triticum turgidum subsp. durum]
MDAAAVAAEGEESAGRHEKVSFMGLFRHADGKDQLLMLVGTVAALANGMTTPLMTVFFGDVLDAFGHATDANVLQRVNKGGGAIARGVVHKEGGMGKTN